MTHFKASKTIIALLLATTSILSACQNIPLEGADQDTLSSETQQLIRYDFVRNATARLDYNGKTFLLDPMLSEKGELPSFAGVSRNPTVGLPSDIRSIISGIDGVIVGHMHADHFDQAAADALPKDIPILTPKNSAPINPANPAEAPSFKVRLEGLGFTNVTEIGETVTWQDTQFTQVWGRHGEGKVGDLMGGVNGLILQSEDQPTLYWTGDTVIGERQEALDILRQYRPEIVIAHTGGPVVPALSDEILLMDAAQAKILFQEAKRVQPNVEIIAVHMDALDHSFSTRADLLSELNTDWKSGLVHIPNDGETISFDRPK